MMVIGKMDFNMDKENILIIMDKNLKEVGIMEFSALIEF